MITKRYTIVRTSFGDVFITADHDRITRISTERPHISVAMRNDTLPILKNGAQALTRYLSGECTAFTTDLPLHFLPFQRDIFKAVQSIPYGQSITSDELAHRIGKPHAVRAVETICRNNPLYIAVPCHRILFSNKPTSKTPTPLLPDEALRRLEKRYLDKDVKRR